MGRASAERKMAAEFRSLRTDSKTRKGWQLTSQSEEVKHLSVGMCAMITSYYRLAVQKNKGDVDAIVQAVNAIPLHLGANYENAKENHRLTPIQKIRGADISLISFISASHGTIRTIFLNKQSILYSNYSINTNTTTFYREDQFRNDV